MKSGAFNERDDHDTSIEERNGCKRRDTTEGYSAASCLDLESGIGGVLRCEILFHRYWRMYEASPSCLNHHLFPRQYPPSTSYAERHPSCDQAQSTKRCDRSCDLAKALWI